MGSLHLLPYVRGLASSFGIDEDLLYYDHEWREGDRHKAKEIAKEYINKHREVFTPVLQHLTLEELVQSVEMARITGRIGDRLILDMWILSEFEPQNITGVIDVVLPDPRALMEAVNGRIRD